MTWSLIPIYYLIIGGVFFALVFLFPEDYRRMMKKALMVIKVAGVKSKQAQTSMRKEYEEKYGLKKREEIEAAEIKVEGETYAKEIDADAEKTYEEIKDNPNKASRTLFGLFVGWPLIVFITGMAAVLSSVYLTEQELLDIEAQV